MKKVLLILQVSLALWVCGAGTSSAAVAVTFDPNSGTGLANNNTIGWRFGLTTDISVTSLGVLNGVLTTGNGQAGVSHEVGIYSEATQQLLAYAVVTNGAAGSTEQWRWTELSTPVVLTAGSIYRIATYANGDKWFFNTTNYATSAEVLVGTALDPGAPPSANPGSRTAAYAPGTNVLQYPSDVSIWTVNDIHDGLFGANFQYTAVPEPSSVALATLAGVGLLVFAGRKVRVVRIGGVR
jgi:hypothetical protein